MASSSSCNDVVYGNPYGEQCISRDHETGEEFLSDLYIAMRDGNKPAVDYLTDNHEMMQWVDVLECPAHKHGRYRPWLSNSAYFDHACLDSFLEAQGKWTIWTLAYKAEINEEVIKTKDADDHNSNEASTTSTKDADGHPGEPKRVEYLFHESVLTKFLNYRDDYILALLAKHVPPQALKHRICEPNTPTTTTTTNPPYRRVYNSSFEYMWNHSVSRGRYNVMHINPLNAAIYTNPINTIGSLLLVRAIEHGFFATIAALAARLDIRELVGEVEHPVVGTKIVDGEPTLCQYKYRATSYQFNKKILVLLAEHGVRITAPTVWEQAEDFAKELERKYKSAAAADMPFHPKGTN